MRYIRNDLGFIFKNFNHEHFKLHIFFHVIQFLDALIIQFSKYIY
jgi:hypothetical protein